MQLIKLIEPFANFADSYRAKVVKPWLGPPRFSLALITASALMIFTAMVANSFVRQMQLDELYKAPRQHDTNSASMFSTADAPHFLRQAKLMSNGEGVLQQESLRSFPNLTHITEDAKQDTSLRSRPLLSVLLMLASDTVRNDELLTVGNSMIIITAAATALMIGICFGASGYWAEGATAGLGGGLSTAYLVRSSIGRIDTDQLNLGFIYLLFGIAIFVGRATSRRQCFLMCALGGLIANLFMWWYSKPEMVVMTSIAIVWLLVCLHRNFMTVIIGTALFVGLSGIAYVNPMETVYLKETISRAGFIYPNTLNTISEVRQVSLMKILVNSTGSLEIGFFCLCGLALFLVRHPVIAVAYGPLVFFALLNFIIGNRAIFYSAPIFWFGGAYLITTTTRFVSANVFGEQHNSLHESGAVIFGASLALIVAWFNSPTDYMPKPSFPEQILHGLEKLKFKADPENSVVATWWDYGYASMFFNGLPTFHDGGTHAEPTTHFVARAFLDAEQARSIGNLKFLATRGQAGIAAENSLADLQQEFSKAVKAPSPDLYVVVTSQMGGWMSSISQIGNWDIEKGEPVDLQGNPNGPLVNYERLNCSLAGYPVTLTCSTTLFDLERGLVNGAPALAGWAHSKDGSVVRNKTFNHEGDHAVQIVQMGNRINVFQMHRQLFESTFNELFYLGQINHQSISLHYDNYPHVRIYKIDGEPQG